MKKILIAVMAVVLCLGLMGGAFAYFTDVEKSTGNTMGAGTLNIEISDNDQGYRNSAVTASYVSPAGWAPGDRFITDPVFLENVGTIDIERIYARFCNFDETDGTPAEFDDGVSNIGDFIKLVAYAESNDGGATWYYESFIDGFTATDATVVSGSAANANDYLNYWIGRGATFIADGVISLRDLVDASAHGSGDKVTALCMFDGGNVGDDPPLQPTEIAAFKFVFELPSTMTNEYQGDSASFNVNFIAAQIDTYPDDLLDDSITETLDDLLAP